MAVAVAEGRAGCGGKLVCVLGRVVFSPAPTPVIDRHLALAIKCIIQNLAFSLNRSAAIFSIQYFGHTVRLAGLA